jgi:hypothetical protein
MVGQGSRRPCDSLSGRMRYGLASNGFTKGDGREQRGKTCGGLGSAMMVDDKKRKVGEHEVLFTLTL